MVKTAQQNQRAPPDIFTEAQLPLPAEEHSPKKKKQGQIIRGKLSHISMLHVSMLISPGSENTGLDLIICSWW